MSDLTERLRGNYKIGPDGEYGNRDFSEFIPPISIEAAERIEKLENALMRCNTTANEWVGGLSDKILLISAQALSE